MQKKILAALLLPLAAACGGGSSSNPLNPVNQPEIVNLTDSFSFQVTNVSDGSGSFTYDWVNTGTAATVNRSSDVASGSVVLTVREASGGRAARPAGPPNRSWSSTRGHSSRSSCWCW